MNTPTYNIQQGDCLELMKGLPDNSVDCVVTDPPYNVNYNYSNYKDNLPFADYLSWQLEILVECERVLSDNGSLFYLNYPEFNSYIYCNLDTDFKLKPKEIITWVYNTHTGGNPLRKASRTWIWASKGNILNNFTGEYKNPQDKRIKQLIEQNKLPKSYDWWEIQQIKNVCAEKTKHPCQIPVEMVENIIKSTTNLSDTILDPFMGSGTTGVACMNLNRNFIGYELDQEYFKIAEARIKNAKNKLDEKLL